MKRLMLVLVIAMVISLIVGWVSIGCSKVNLRDPESYGNFNGTVIHYYDKLLLVESGPTRMQFRVGRKTRFTPIRRVPSIGDSVNVRYLKWEYDSRRVGKYFIAFEIHNVSD